MKITSTKGTATVDTIEAAAAWLVEMQPAYASVDGVDLDCDVAEWTEENATAAIEAARAGDDVERCECGDWSGEPCQWTGPAADMVIVEWMPEEHRSSHAAVGNSGSYPANGARRSAVERSCADLMIETDGEWSRIVGPVSEAAS
jgi:hypothetical protein